MIRRLHIDDFIAAKLGRMGYVAAPFAGNVSLFDLLAADQRGFTIPNRARFTAHAAL